MLISQQIELRLVELRSAIGAFPADGDAADLEKLTTEYRAADVRKAAAMITEAADLDAARVAGDLDAGQRELDGIGRNLQFGNYLSAAVEHRAATGAESEWNAAHGMGAQQFPLAMLAPARVQMRATTDTDGQVNQGRWIDRLFAMSAGARLGMTYESVPAGTSAYHTTTAGVTPGQRSRGQAATDSAWTVGVVSLEPKRNAVSAKYAIEDAARLPGLADALRRDMSAGLVDAIDQIIFIGDASATTGTDDIAGLDTYAGLTEVEISQANKVKGETLAAFTGLIDGLHAQDLADLNVVASVGAYRLWADTVINATADNMTLAQFMMASGLSWSSRANIDVNTADGDFGAFVGRARGIAGAGVSAVWDAGQMIVDFTTRAKEGECILTMNYLHNIGYPRLDNFARVVFAS